MKSGKFIDLRIDFEVDGKKISASEQAKKILEKANALVKKGSKGMAIIYSANYGQTRDIQRTYLSGEYCAQILGANQAQVMFEMERMLSGIYNSLQYKMRIAPITTMNGYSNPVPNWNNDVLLGIIQTDLDRIENYLLSGWSVFGWQNQLTAADSNAPYAIGGGVVKLPAQITDTIQERLKKLKFTYS